MAKSASTLLPASSNVGELNLHRTLLTVAGLKATIDSEGVWRIRKREKVPVLEVFKVEESGTGDILPPDFVAWRLDELPSLQQVQDLAVHVGTNGSEAEPSKPVIPVFEAEHHGSAITGVIQDMRFPEVNGKQTSTPISALEGGHEQPP